jgi:hypothetical protein
MLAAQVRQIYTKAGLRPSFNVMQSGPMSTELKQTRFKVDRCSGFIRLESVSTLENRSKDSKPMDL